MSFLASAKIDFFKAILGLEKKRYYILADFYINLNKLNKNVILQIFFILSRHQY